MISGILLIGVLVLISMLFIGMTQKQVAPSGDSVNTILATLPQTQCSQCHFAGCRPYAQAIAQHQADIYQCPPGGTDTINALTNLLGQHTHLPKANDMPEKQPRVAIINEAECIGCVKCIQVCPTDAIIGARKQMHVILSAACTGCELCIAPCPMNCISLTQLPS